MRKIIQIIMLLLIANYQVNAQARKYSIKSYFEDENVIRFITTNYNKEVDSAKLYRIENAEGKSVSSISDLGIQDSSFVNYLGSFLIRDEYMLNKNEGKKISEIFSDKLFYAYSTMDEKRKLITTYDCNSTIGSYDYVVIIYGKYGRVIELLLSSENKRYILKYKFENMVFILKESCFNQFGWNALKGYLTTLSPDLVNW